MVSSVCAGGVGDIALPTMLISNDWLRDYILLPISLTLYSSQCVCVCASLILHS